MYAPKDIERSPKGKLKAFSKAKWASGSYGMWYVIDSEGKIITSSPDLWKVARKVNRHNLKMDE